MKVLLASILVTAFSVVGGLVPKVHLSPPEVSLVTPKVVAYQAVKVKLDEIHSNYAIVPLTHEDYMHEAGISASDYKYVDYIATHESNWRVDADGSLTVLGRAHGVLQFLPYSKTGCGWVDEVCQLRWGNSYAKERYGSWAAAAYYWTTHSNW